MYIKKEDYAYLETLCKGLDEAAQKKLMALLGKAASDRAGEDLLSKIQVVGDEIYDAQGLEPGDWLTRTMIKKAYKETKKGPA